MKRTLSILFLCIILALSGMCWSFTRGVELAEKAYNNPPHRETVEQQIKRLQARIGAEPDGIIGYETMSKANKTVKAEQREKFDRYAVCAIESSEIPIEKLDEIIREKLK
jgi:murein L,D-transpeptidase YcbB/YkuD